MKLFDLAEDLKYLRDVYQNDEAITDEMLQQAEMNVESKIRTYCILIKEMKAEQKAVSDQKRKLDDRRIAIGNNIDKVLGVLHNVQTELGLKTVTVDGHRSTLTAKAPALIIENEDDIPDEFIVNKRIVAKQLAKENFKETGEVPEGFTLKTGETYIRVS